MVGRCLICMQKFWQKGIFSITSVISCVTKAHKVGGHSLNHLYSRSFCVSRGCIFTDLIHQLTLLQMNPFLKKLTVIHGSHTKKNSIFICTLLVHHAALHQLIIILNLGQKLCNDLFQFISFSMLYENSSLFFKISQRQIQSKEERHGTLFVCRPIGKWSKRLLLAFVLK